MILDSRDRWPFLQRDDFPAGDAGYEAYRAARNERDNTWVEISDEHKWQLLECVPPRYMRFNCFAVGEASHDDAQGRTCYANVLTVVDADLREHHYLRTFPVECLLAMWADLRAELASSKDTAAAMLPAATAQQPGSEEHPQ